ncbi:unnamed protein product [Nezara viridula]|uniref:Uncharacterized protein n=1 Tax=Nezara viridula TaxID=85310 RepID=A0A9P0E4I4_NEZVI|nr:unnamed protein product [Nezara viridula]
MRIVGTVAPVRELVWISRGKAFLQRDRYAKLERHHLLADIGIPMKAVGGELGLGTDVDKVPRQRPCDQHYYQLSLLEVYFPIGRVDPRVHLQFRVHSSINRANLKRRWEVED